MVWPMVAAAAIGAAGSYLSSRQQSGAKLHGFQERALKEYERRMRGVADRPYEAYEGVPYAPINPYLAQMYGYLPGMAESGYGQYGLADQWRSNAGDMGYAQPGAGWQNQAGQGYWHGSQYVAPTLDAGQNMAYANQYANPQLAQRQVAPGLEGAMLAGRNALQGAAGYTPQDISTLEIDKATRELMNPYDQMVIDTTRADMDRARQMAQLNRSEQFGAMGGLGGSGHMRADVLTNEAFARELAKTTANLRQAGYTQAQQAGLDMLTGNRARGLQGAQLRGQMGGQLADLGYRDYSTTQGLQAEDFDRARRLGFETGATNQKAGMQAQQMRQRAYENMMNLGLRQDQQQLARAQFARGLAGDLERAGQTRLGQAYKMGQDYQQYEERGPAWEYQQWLNEWNYPIKMAQLYGQAATETAQPYQSGGGNNPWLMAGLGALGGAASAYPQYYRQQSQPVQGDAYMPAQQYYGQY